MKLLYSENLTERLHTCEDFRSLVSNKAKQSYIHDKSSPGVKELYFKEDDSIFSKISSVSYDSQLSKASNMATGEIYRADICKVFCSTKVSKHRNKIKSKKHGQILNQIALINYKQLSLAPSHVRLFEYAFLVDSEIFTDEFTKNAKLFNTQLDVYYYKLSINSTKSIEEGIYKIDYEEKSFFGNRSTFDLNHWDYYNKWLLSLGNKKALIFGEQIKKLCYQNKKACYRIKLFITNFYDKVYLSDIKLNLDHYLQKINEKTQAYIKSKPYFTRTKKYNIQSNTCDLCLVEEQYNDELINLMQYQDSEKDIILRDLLKFKIQRNIKTNDYYNNVLDVPQFAQSFQAPDNVIENPHCVQTKNTLVILSKDGLELQEGHCEIWKESWISNGNIFTKSYNVVSVDKVLNYN